MQPPDDEVPRWFVVCVLAAGALCIASVWWFVVNRPGVLQALLRILDRVSAGAG